TCSEHLFGHHVWAFSSLSPRERAGGEGLGGGAPRWEAPHPNPLPEGRAPVKLGALSRRSRRGRGYKSMPKQAPCFCTRAREGLGGQGVNWYGFCDTIGVLTRALRP